jgi:hypothetical protein
MASGKRSALAVGLVLAFALIAGLAWVSGRHQPGIGRSVTPGDEVGPGGSGVLSIEGITVTDSLNNASQVEAQAVATWSGDEFPGIYSCSFIARDQEGREVGRYEDIVASLSAPNSFPVKVDASSPATSVDATCGDRLDTGTPYRYDLSNVHVTSGSELPGMPSHGAAAVGFDANWAGGGQAGAVACHVAVVDEAGAVIGSSDFNLFILMGSGTGLTTRVDVSGVPASAEFDCSPFAG